jgi:hypothetical protein
MRMTATVLKLIRWTAVCGIVLASVAALLYPGGTVRNPSTSGYSLFGNSLSDLGSTIAWNGQSNYYGARFFTSGLGLLAIACAGTFFVLVRAYSSPPITHRLAGAACVLGILACASLIGAANTPEDRNSLLHGRFTLLACGAFLVATLLFALATALNDRFPRRVPIGWLTLTFLLLTWLLVGPLRLIHDPGLTITISGQKILGIALLAILALESYEAERIIIPRHEC